MALDVDGYAVLQAMASADVPFSRSSMKAFTPMRTRARLHNCAALADTAVHRPK